MKIALLTPDPAVAPASGATTTTTPPAKEPEKLSPMVADLLKSMNMVLEPEATPDNDLPQGPRITLGQAAEWIEQEKKSGKPASFPDKAVDANKPAATAQAAAAPVTTTAAAPAATATAPATPARPAVIKRAEPPAETVTTTTTQPAAATAPVLTATEEAAKKADEETKAYIASLNQEQQDEIELARYSEKAGKKGLVGTMVEYYRKVDDFAAKNPDASEEDLDKFLKENKPAWSENERWKAKSAMLEESAVARVRKELEPQVQENALKVRRMESAPTIEQAVTGAQESMTRGPVANYETVRAVLEEKGYDEALKQFPQEAPKVKEALDNGTAPIDTAVIKAITEKGYEAATKEFPIEAPIVQGTLQATRAWEELRNGLRSPEGPLDEWVIGFVAGQGNEVMRWPKENRTLPDGRVFVPMQQALGLPPAERAKVWTFDDPGCVSVGQLLTENAILKTNSRIKELESAGFSRKGRRGAATTAATAEKVSAQTERTTTTATANGGGGGGSPVVTGNALPGMTDESGQSKYNEFVTRILG